MRPRDLDRLAPTPYDVLVVGGGIHGLMCAYEAASRGLAVALVDAGDYGSGASFNHQKTAHGGLRALQSLSLARARHGIRERRTLARIAPALLRPLPFLFGTYRSIARSRPALRAAFAVDRWIGRDRNAGVEPELHLPAARLLSPTTTRKLFPGIRSAGLTGGAQFYDYQMVENDRLTLAVAAAADRAGATLANYVRATSLLREHGRLAGARVADVLTGRELDVRARLVVNAAGAWAEDVLQLFGVSRRLPLVKAMNLVISTRAADLALASPGTNGRMLTLVPWRGRAIFGTWQSPDVTTLADAAPRPDEIDRCIVEANHAFPALRLTREAVVLVHCGLVPAVVRGSSADLLPDPQILDHAPHADGLVTLLGAKYTTARATAERLVERAAGKLGTRLSPSMTAKQVLPGAGIADHEALAIETARRVQLDLPSATIRHLTSRYGEAAASVVTSIAERPELARPLALDGPTIAAEVLHAIHHEQAVCLSDIILRRTTVGAAGHPGGAALQTAAAVAGPALDWTAVRMAAEIEAVEAVYRIPG